MKARNGSVVSSRRMIGVCAMLAMLVSAMFTSNALAKKPTLNPTAYVALGDSISFGYKEETFYKNEEANKAACEKDELAACEPPSSFERGFVGDVGKKLARPEKEVGNGLQTIDLGCPGETSGGLIGNGPLGSELEEERAAKHESALDLSAPCGYENVDGFSLKTPLGGVSELEAALGLLQEGANVKAITIQIGSNDELASIAKCENPEYDAEQGFSSLVECLETEVSEAGHEYPGGVFTHIITNIGVAIGVLREVGHYDGPIVILGFYNPQAELLAGSNALQEALNAHLEATVNAGKFGSGVAVAPIMAKFNPEHGKEAKAICKYTEECNTYDKVVNWGKAHGHSPENAEQLKEAEEFPEGDIHPTKVGYAMMAKAVESAFGTL
jgi:lysophospholipase L1-like esterase